MKKLLIGFTGFWPGFEMEHNYFIDLLRTKYDVEVSDTPEYIFYSVWEKNITKYKCKRIFFTGENQRPNFNECDFSFGFDYSENPDHYRLPLYALYGAPESLIIPQDQDVDIIFRAKTKFCIFIYSNSRNGSGTKKRNALFHKLSKHKRVDSGGRYMNNMGGPVASKIDCIKDYKFTFAFENEEHPGYTTEKIFEPMQVRSVPLYWGNPEVARDFNTKSFLNWYEYRNDDAFIKRIIEIDNNDELYKGYLRQPYFPNNVVNPNIQPASVLKQFEYIFQSKKIPNYTKTGPGRWRSIFSH